MKRQAFIAITVAATLLLSLTAIPMPRNAEAQTTVISDTRVETTPRTVNAGDTLLISGSQSAWGYLETRSLTNYGTIVVQGHLFASHKDAIIHNYGLIIVVAPGAVVAGENGIVGNNDMSGGRIINHLGATINVDRGASFGGNHVTNEGTINSYGGTGYSSGYTNSFSTNAATGVINNYSGSTMDIGAGWPGESSATFVNRGRVNNNAGATIALSQGFNVDTPRAFFDNFGTVLNAGTVDNDQGGAWKQECGAVLTNQPGSVFLGTTINACQPPFTPITHMSDTTISYGVQVGGTSSQIIAAEWVKPTSQLVGDKIDSITLRLQRVGAPTGSYEVGVFDANRNLKRLFGGGSPGSIPTTMTNIEFKLPADQPLYTIQTDDRIGIFFTGGSGNNGYISVMMDKVTSDSVFDGQNTQRIRGLSSGSWFSLDSNEDLYMILKQTRAS